MVQPSSGPMITARHLTAAAGRPALPAFARLGLGLVFVSLLEVIQPTGFAADIEVRKLEPRIWSCTFQSEALRSKMRFIVVLPAETATPVPVIYFLHGRGRDETTLIKDEFCRRALLSSRCAFVLPRGLDGWYVDSPVIPADRFGSYLDEVIATAEKRFPLSCESAGRAIGGWSMGGYGAAYTFGRRAGDFAALATIIGIVDYPRAVIEPAALNYPVQPRFGNDMRIWETINPRLLLRNAPRRPLFVAIADRAPERQMNDAFIADARTLGFPVTEMRIPAEHVFAAVREALPAAVGFLELQLLPPPVNPPPRSG